MLMQDFLKQKSKNGLQTISIIATKVVTDMQEKRELDNYANLSIAEKKSYALNALATLMVEEMDKTVEYLHYSSIERQASENYEQTREVDGYILER